MPVDPFELVKNKRFPELSPPSENEISIDQCLGTCMIILNICKGKCFKILNCEDIISSIPNISIRVRWLGKQPPLIVNIQQKEQEEQKQKNYSPQDVEKCEECYFKCVKKYTECLAMCNSSTHR